MKVKKHKLHHNNDIHMKKFIINGTHKASFQSIVDPPNTFEVDEIEIAVEVAAVLYFEVGVVTLSTFVPVLAVRL